MIPAMSEDRYPALRDQRLHKHKHGEGERNELERQVHEHGRCCGERFLAVPVAVCNERSNRCLRWRCIFPTRRRASLVSLSG
jgi:hypothetical protein